MTYSLVGPMAVAQKGPVNWVCLSYCQEVILELALFLELNMVCGTHAVFCMKELDFLKKYLPPKMGKIGQA